MRKRFGNQHPIVSFEPALERSCLNSARDAFKVQLNAERLSGASLGEVSKGFPWIVLIHGAGAASLPSDPRTARDRRRRSIRVGQEVGVQTSIKQD